MVQSHEMGHDEQADDRYGAGRGITIYFNSVTATLKCNAEVCPRTDNNKQSSPDPFIPAVSEWGLVIFALLLLFGVKIYFNRR